MDWGWVNKKTKQKTQKQNDFCLFVLKNFFFLSFISQLDACMYVRILAFLADMSLFTEFQVYYLISSTRWMIWKFSKFIKEWFFFFFFFNSWNFIKWQDSEHVVTIALLLLSIFRPFFVEGDKNPWSGGVLSFFPFKKNTDGEVIEK